MIHDQSRLLLTSVVEYTNFATGKLRRPRYFDIRDRVTATADDDRFATATSARQWSHMGRQYLEDARNWWVIADLSDVVDPFEDLENETTTEGTFPKTLRIPSYSRFVFRILTGRDA